MRARSLQLPLMAALALPSLLTPAVALGQEDGEPKPAAVDPAAAPLVEPDNDAFLIKRGFFSQADLGVFFTFGGRNTNDVQGLFPAKSLSNVQPFLGVFAGYDVFHTDKLNLGVGLKFGAAYSTGSGRVTEQDVAMLGQAVSERAADFGIYQAGLGVAFSYLVSPRIALSGKLDGGLAVVDPDPFVTATEPGAGGSAVGGLFGVGVGVEYYTLLNDFSVGLDLRFGMALMGGGSIPGLGVTVPLKYTF